TRSSIRPQWCGVLLALRGSLVLTYTIIVGVSYHCRFGYGNGAVRICGRSIYTNCAEWCLWNPPAIGINYSSWFVVGVMFQYDQKEELYVVEQVQLR
ncbi:hypothetical protein ARMGADRAFT_1136857, partial [Armillaria gallica]